MIGARKGSPLAIGDGEGEMYLGSDAIALAPFTDTISYLEDGDWVVLTREVGIDLRRAGWPFIAIAEIRRVVVSGRQGQLRHFMAKEIHEQPEVVGHTLARYVDMATERVALPLTLPFDFRDIQRISITACGTASYAGSVAKYWFERFAPPPGRARRRLGIPLSRSAGAQGRSWRSSSRSPAKPPIRWPRVRYAKETGAAHAVRRQRATLDDCPRKRDGAADAGGPGNRRRLDQGIHLPVDGAGRHRGRRRHGARRIIGRRRDASSSTAWSKSRA